MIFLNVQLDSVWLVWVNFREKLCCSGFSFCCVFKKRWYLNTKPSLYSAGWVRICAYKSFAIQPGGSPAHGIPSPMLLEGWDCLSCSPQCQTVSGHSGKFADCWSRWLQYLEGQCSREWGIMTEQWVCREPGPDPGGLCWNSVLLLSMVPPSMWLLSRDCEQDIMGWKGLLK